MGVIRSAAGMVWVSLTSAEPGEALSTLGKQGIEVYHAEPDGDLTLRFSILRRDYRRAAAVCQKRGDRLRILRRSGIYWTLKGLIRRPVLIAGLAILLFLSMYLPSRVLFVRVEGNEKVPVNRILAAAEECGLSFGTSRREVRSEKVKNGLLEMVPELQWAGVNTRGCVAVITVRERSITSSQEALPAVSSIVASTDGVILTATATKGSLCCQPGQAVVQGQVLISGYTDCGLMIQATRAEGEVYARTMRELTVFAPTDHLRKVEITGEKINFSLIIGKKRINLWKDSGISDTSCGRMYEEYYITLPGGFQLPVALVKETVVYYETVPVTATAEDIQKAIEGFSEDLIKQQMIAGIIQEKHFSLENGEGKLMMQGTFLCTEMIGRQKAEEIGDIHE